MKKRVLSLFMAFVLCLTLLPAPALAVADTTDVQDTGTEGAFPHNAEIAVNRTYANGKGTAMQNGIAVQTVEYAAKIGDMQYTSLPEALEAAKDDDTVTLLTDVNNTGKTAYITGNKTVTLDINGKTISEGWISAGTNDQNDSSTLKIVGEGSLTHSGYEGNLSVYPGSVLDLSG